MLNPTHFTNLLRDLQASHELMGRQLEELSRLSADPPAATGPALISVNQEADRDLWTLGGLNAWHLKWTPPAEGTSEDEQARANRELMQQVESFVAARTSSRAPGFLSSDGAGTLWAAKIKEVLTKLPGTDALGKFHVEIFDQWTSAHLRDGSLTAGGIWKLGPQTTNTLAGLENKARALNGSPLTPGGQLGLEDGRITWNGDPVRLHGLSPTYGALCTRRIDGPAMVRFLADQGVNLWRVWCIEQWTGLDHGEDGLCLWAGRKGSYDLYNFNTEWWDGLQATLEEAESRGVVIQLSLFDWAGYLQAPERGRWRDNPLNATNNLQDLIPEAVSNGRYPQAITNTEGPVWEVFHNYLVKIRETVATKGNVILEIANEPRHVRPQEERKWHQAVAGVLRGES